MRASGSDDNIMLTPATILSLEECLSFINDDELIDSGLLPGFISPVGLQSKTKIHLLYDN